MDTENPGNDLQDPAASELGEFEIQEVKYSLPLMLRELQLERSQSHFAKEIIDQIEITRIFSQARKARARNKQH